MGRHTPPRIAFPAGIEYEPNTGCWLWSVGVAAYGSIAVASGAHVPVHRYSFQTYKGPIPNGLQVCHKCDTPSCVNPDHLFLGTVKDNAQDCRAKERHRYGARAPKHPPYKPVMPARRAAYQERMRGTMPSSMRM